MRPLLPSTRLKSRLLLLRSFPTRIVHVIVWWVRHKLKSEDFKVQSRALAEITSLEDGDLLADVIHLMLNHWEPEVRSEARMAIKRTRPAGAAGSLTRLAGPLLADPDPYKRSETASQLESLGWIAPTALDRARVAVALHKFDVAIKEKEAALEPLLLEATTATYENVASDAMTAMARLGAPALPHLMRLFHTGTPKVRISAVKAIANLAKDEGASFLVETLRGSDRAASAIICSALAWSPVAATAPALIELFLDTSADAKSRCDAARGLSGIASEAAVGTLLKGLTDPNQNIREVVAFSLGRAKNRIAVPALCAAVLEDSSARVRGTAASSLGRIGDLRAKDVLMKGLAKGEEADASGCVCGLGMLRVEEAVGPLLNLFTRLFTVYGYPGHKVDAAREHSDTALLGEVLAALGEIGDPRATSTLINVLHSKEDGGGGPPPWSNRWKIAAIGLGNIGGREAMTALEDFLCRNPISAKPDPYSASDSMKEAAKETLDALKGGKPFFRRLLT